MALFEAHVFLADSNHVTLEMPVLSHPPSRHRCCIHHRRLPSATLNKVCGSVNDLCGPVDPTSAYKAEEAAFQAHLVRPKWVFSQFITLEKDEPTPPAS